MAAQLNVTPGRRRLLRTGAAALLGAAPWVVARAQASGPDLTLSTATGPLQLSRLPARVIYLDFWASWCAPCRLSFPWMAEMHARHAANGLAVVAVNVDVRAADAETFLRARPPPFTIAYDPAGQAARACAVSAMPSSLLLAGGTLKLIQRHAGFRPSDAPALEAALLAALAG